jgi:hypothetical protein
MNQRSRLGGRKLGRIYAMEDWAVSTSSLGSPRDRLETGEVEQQEGYAVTEKAATPYEVSLVDIARPGKQRCKLTLYQQARSTQAYTRLARKRGKSMDTQTISRGIDMEFTERWELER